MSIVALRFTGNEIHNCVLRVAQLRPPQKLSRPLPLFSQNAAVRIHALGWSFLRFPANTRHVLATRYGRPTRLAGPGCACGGSPAQHPKWCNVPAGYERVHVSEQAAHSFKPSHNSLQRNDLEALRAPYRPANFGSITTVPKIAEQWSGTQHLYLLHF